MLHQVTLYDDVFLMFWTPGSSLKGPIKWSLCARPSVLLSGHFFEIGSLVCTKFWHVFRNLYEVERDCPLFLKENCPNRWAWLVVVIAPVSFLF